MWQSQIDRKWSIANIINFFLNEFLTKKMKHYADI